MLGAMSPLSMGRPDGREPWFQLTGTNPSTAGLDLPVGSICEYVGARYVKFGTAATQWSLIGISGNQPIQTITQTTPAASMQVNGLDGDAGRLYRLVWHLNSGLTTLGWTFNATAASRLASQSFGNLAGAANTGVAVHSGVANGDTYGESLLVLKSGKVRFIAGFWALYYAPTPEIDRWSYLAQLTSGAANITSVTLTASGNFTGTCDVYDAGTAR